MPLVLGLWSRSHLDDSALTKVLWMPLQSPETWQEYLQRVQTEGSHGLATGMHQLGVRVSATDARWSEPAHKWTIRWLPKAWTTGDVLQVLQAMGYEKIVISCKCIQRNGTSWFYTALHKDGLQSLQEHIASSDAQVSTTIEVQAMMDSKRRGAPSSHSRGLQPERRYRTGCLTSG